MDLPGLRGLAGFLSGVLAVWLTTDWDYNILRNDKRDQVWEGALIMNVLTLSRQLGSEGDRIATAVAKSLKWSYMNHAIINRAARQAGLPEVALAQIDELGFLGINPSPKDHRAYLNQVESVIQELADKGDVVIVGCAGQKVLADCPGALHVQLVAPFELRLARLMAQEGISEEAAIERLIASDKRRANYLKKNYGVNWLDPALYDLVINTAKINPDDAIDCIIRLLRSGKLQTVA